MATDPLKSEIVTVRLTDRPLIQRLGTTEQRVEAKFAQRLIDQGKAVLISGKMNAGSKDKMIYTAPVNKSMVGNIADWGAPIFPEDVIAATG
jgi:hypothetical protein